MKKWVGIAAGLAALAFAALWAVNSGFDYALPGLRSKSTACTADAPCEIRLLFAATGEAANRMAPGLLERVAEDNVAALRAAFARSGIDNVTFAAPTVLDRPIDAGRVDRIDAPANWTDPAGFNRRLLRWLPSAKARGELRSANIAVVFSGFRGEGGACYANALAGSGHVVVPGCLLDSYVADAKVRMAQKIMLLHEVGHIFGAFHNDNGNPQPCRVAAEYGKDPGSCAWEQCTGRTCTAEELFDAPDAFCTLVGQYNYQAGPTGESYCRAHRGGEQGTGWILEYSHRGKCRTPGYEAYDCGDAGHDAATVMRLRAVRVAGSRPLLN